MAYPRRCGQLRKHEVNLFLLGYLQHRVERERSTEWLTWFDLLQLKARDLDRVVYRMPMRFRRYYYNQNHDEAMKLFRRHPQYAPPCAYHELFMPIVKRNAYLVDLFTIRTVSPSWFKAWIQTANPDRLLQVYHAYSSWDYPDLWVLMQLVWHMGLRNACRIKRHYIRQEHTYRLRNAAWGAVMLARAKPTFNTDIMTRALEFM